MGNKQGFPQRRQAFLSQRNRNIQLLKVLLSQKKKQLQITQSLQTKVIKSNLTQLVFMLNQLVVSSEQLVIIYAYRTATLGMELNLITQENFEEAISMAKKCDLQRKKNQKRNWTFQDQAGKEQHFLPPLFGIPISIKDAFDQKGKRTTLGLFARLNSIKEEDCGTLVALKINGIIPFVRSNVSQTLMTFQTVNFIFGRSLNIWNKERSTGGSSGGQSGLIASLCSPFGIGNDIGGSVRIPALFTGLCSIKCCQERYDISAQYSSYSCPTFNGKTTFISVTGPLAKSVEDLSLYLKCMLNDKCNPKLSPNKLLKPFDSVQYLRHNQKKLKIGYYKSHSILQTTKASQRAVQQTVDYLTSLGHELIQIQIPKMKEIIQLYLGEQACEGHYTFMQQFLQGEPSIPSFKKPRLITKMPNYLRRCLFYVIKRMYPRLFIFLEGAQKMTVEQYLRHKDSVYKVRKQFVSWWRSYELDHIITPDFGCQANYNDMTGELFPCAIYTFIWNLLNFPSGALSITTVRQDEQTYESVHNDPLSSALKLNCLNSKGLPVGIQIIGLPNQQQKILSVMKLVQSKYPNVANLYKVNNLQ